LRSPRGEGPMTGKVVKDKVLCYVVRDGRLLVFRHRGLGPLHTGLLDR
jgi:hypothetical protein